MKNDFGDSISVLEEFEARYMRCHNRYERMKVQMDVKKVLCEVAYVMFLDFVFSWLRAKDSEEELSS